MRHRVAARKLNRTTSHRRAMLGNMVASLLQHEAIRTTVPKAKEARRLADRIITLGKRGGLSNVRRAASILHNRSLLQKVFGDLRQRYADRPGGYTRIVRIGHRLGDAAEMAILELVDRIEVEPKPKAEKKAKGQEPESSAAPEPTEKVAKAETTPSKPPKKRKEAAGPTAKAPKGSAGADRPAVRKTARKKGES
jgi:large subunit ribosomal protein L17